MAEETAEEKREREERERREAEEKKRKKPWGSDEEFNPEKAWKLIENLRSELDTVKTERTELKTKVQEHEDASKTEQEKLTEGKSSAEQRASSAESEAARLRVAIKKGLSETQAKRLVGDDEEALEKDADELLASFKREEEEDEGGQEPRRRPQERLRSGTTRSREPEKDDPESLAAAVPRGF